MFKIKKQISKLYMASILGNLSLTGAWVAILAARGYSLVEIGIAETVFHIFSLTFEDTIWCFCGCIWTKADACCEQYYASDWKHLHDLLKESDDGVCSNRMFCSQL